MASNIIKDDAKEKIQLLTDDLKLTEDASTVLLGAQGGSIESLAVENTPHFITQKLCDIVERFNKSSLKEIDAKNGVESLMTELQAMKDEGTCGTKISTFLNDNERKFERHEDFCLELTQFLNVVELDINHLVSEETSQFSIDIRKKIYFNYLIARESINTQTARVTLTKLRCEKFVNDFRKMGSRIRKVLASCNGKFSASANSSHLEIEGVLKKQEAFITKMIVSNGYLSYCDSLACKILNSLEANMSLLSLTDEHKADFIITKLKDIVERFNKSSLKEIDAKNGVESLMTELQAMKDEGTCETKISTFLNDNERKFERYEDFCLELTQFLNVVELDINHLVSEETSQFSIDIRKQIYFNYLIARESINMQTARVTLIKSRCDLFVNDFRKMGSGIRKVLASCNGKFSASANSSHLDINGVLRKQKAFITIMEVSNGYLSSYDSLTCKILNSLEANMSLLSLTDEHKADFIITKLKDILEEFEVLATKEASGIKLSKWMNSEMKHVKDKGTKNSKIISDIEHKVKMQEEFCQELKAFVDDINLVMDHLKVENVSQFSFNNQRQIFLNLRDVHEGMKFHIDKLNSIKSDYDKFRKVVGSSQLLRFFSNSSLLDIKAGILERQTRFITALNVYIKGLSNNYSFTTILLNSLEEKIASSMTAEDQAYLIVIKLTDLRERLEKSALKEMKVRKVCESMNTELQTIQDRGTDKKKIIKFLNDIKDKVKMHEDFNSEIRAFLKKIESVMDKLEFEKINQFSIKNQREIYFNLLLVRAGMMFRIVRFKSLASSCEKFRNDYGKLAFSNNSPLLDTGDNLLDRELMFINATNFFIERLADFVTKATLVLQSLKENTRTNVNVSSSSEDGNNASVVVEDRSEAMIPKLQSIKEEETYESKAVQFLNDVGKEVEISEKLVLEFKVFFDAIKAVMEYLCSEGTSHLPIENKKLVCGNLLIVCQEITLRIKWLNTIKPSIEKYKDDLDKMRFPLNSAYLRTSTELSGRLTLVILSMKSFIEELGKHKGAASTIIEHLENETKN